MRFFESVKCGDDEFQNGYNSIVHVILAGSDFFLNTTLERWQVPPLHLQYTAIHNSQPQYIPPRTYINKDEHKKKLVAARTSE